MCVSDFLRLTPLGGGDCKHSTFPGPRAHTNTAASDEKAARAILYVARKCTRQAGIHDDDEKCKHEDVNCFFLARVGVHKMFYIIARLVIIHAVFVRGLKFDVAFSSLRSNVSHGVSRSS